MISRSVRLVCKPRDYESITLECQVSHEFGDEFDEQTAADTVQRVLDMAMLADVEEAAACVAEDVTSFIEVWKKED